MYSLHLSEAHSLSSTTESGERSDLSELMSVHRALLTHRFRMNATPLRIDSFMLNNK